MKKQLYKLLFYKKYTDYFKAKEVKKILILRYDRIGDVIVTFPLIQTLKQHYPHYQIDILASEMNQDILVNNPLINNIFLYNFRGKKNFFQFLQTFWKVRKEHYDVVIDPFFNNHSRSAGHLRIINAKFNLGIQKRKKYGLTSDDFKLLYNYSPFDEKLHLTDNLLNIATLFDINKSMFQYQAKFYFTEEEQKTTTDFIQSYQDQKIILFNIQGSSQHRSFNDEFILTLSSKLVEDKKRQVILIAMPNRREKLEKKIHTLQNKNIILAQTKNIRDAIALIKESHLIISPDTSIVHAAAAYSKKIVSFYTKCPLNLALFSPYKTKYKLLFYEDLSILKSKDAEEIYLNIKKENYLP